MSLQHYRWQSNYYSKVTTSEIVPSQSNSFTCCALFKVLTKANKKGKWGLGIVEPSIQCSWLSFIVTHFLCLSDGRDSC